MSSICYRGTPVLVPTNRGGAVMITTDITAQTMIAWSEPSPSSPAPWARRCAASELDRSVRPSSIGRHAVDAFPLMSQNSPSQRAPPKAPANRSTPKQSGCLTHKAPYEGGQSEACPPFACEKCPRGHARSALCPPYNPFERVGWASRSEAHVILPRGHAPSALLPTLPFSMHSEL